MLCQNNISLIQRIYQKKKKKKKKKKKEKKHCPKIRHYEELEVGYHLKFYNTECNGLPFSF
jgi:hypothetical protein